MHPSFRGLNASTHMLEGLHYGGLLRVVRREAGTRAGQHKISAWFGAQARYARKGSLDESS